MQGLSAGEVVRDISFEVRRGEILGLVALEGQGQERLFSLLSGDRAPERRVRSWSEAISAAGEESYDAVGDGVVLIPGDRLLALLPNLPVRQNLVVPLFNRIRQLAAHPGG